MKRKKLKEWWTIHLPLYSLCSGIRFSKFPIGLKIPWINWLQIIHHKLYDCDVMIKNKRDD